MDFDCIIFKDGQEPFIHKVKSDNNNFDIVYPARQTYESFTIERIEEVESATGKPALFLVANKIKVSRTEISKQIKKLNPRPVKYFG